MADEGCIDGGNHCSCWDDGDECCNCGMSPSDPEEVEVDHISDDDGSEENKDD